MDEQRAWLRSKRKRRLRTLAFDGVDYSKHAGVIAFFQPPVCPAKCGRYKPQASAQYTASHGCDCGIC